MSDISVGTLGRRGDPVDASFSSTALQNLDKDAFLQLLVAQMKYQNPMNPVDSNEYLAQAAQYASVEQLENMAESQAELRSMQMVTIATGLVNKEVSAIHELTGELITGRVEQVRFGAEPVLVIDGADVPLSAVVSVSGSEPAPTARPATPVAPGQVTANAQEPPVGPATDSDVSASTVAPPLAGPT